jgi:GTP-binding protein
MESSSNVTIIVAIDGPSGSGKSSTAKGIATRARWRYLDTGALYRAVTWLALKHNSEDEVEIVKLMQAHPISFSADPKNPRIFCGGQDISNEIREDRVTSNVSRISALAQVRQALLVIQQKIIASAGYGIVVEGRDIGTVVAPHAQLKIYLQADISARAARRGEELHNSLSHDIQSVANALSARDAVDSTRTISPLKRAEDAILVDSTNLTLEETIDYIWNILKQRSLLGLPIVTVIGRPNVGKSTLVNRIIGSREAIIEDVPGVTRDRVKYEAEWNGRTFQDSDLVLFVVDAQIGAQSEDEPLVSVLRKSGKDVLLIANKIDSDKDEIEGHSLWNMGLGEPFFVSAAHGRGSGDLLDVIVSRLPEVGMARADDGYRRIAIVGRPNVGKSSLLNSFAGETRSLVDDAEGTTRDPIDELIEVDGKIWRFIDTAGIRRRAHQASGTDYYAMLRTERAIDNAEVIIAVIDSSKIITEQDLRVVSLAEEAGKALVIAMNKWDLVDEDRRNALEREIDRGFDQITWAARVNVAAKTGWHKDRLIPAVERALDSWERRIPTAKLNAFLGSLVASAPPPVRGGKQAKILFATQAGITPPTFVIFATDFLESSYRRFIERRLREEFDFAGSPIRISVRIRER